MKNFKYYSQFSFLNHNSNNSYENQLLNNGYCAVENSVNADDIDLFIDF